MSKTIALDLDSTLINSSLILVQLWNKLNPNRKLTYREDIEWDFSNVLKGKVGLSELFQLFDHKDFYENVIVYDKAIEVVNELSKNYEVIICSKHNDSRKHLTTDWINRTFPNVELVFTDTFDKSEIYNKAWIILDDRIDALESCTNNDTYRMCFGNYTWNKKEWKGSRVLNWEHFERRVRILDEIENCLEIK